MRQLNFKQGSNDWDAWRRTVDSASNAPAMMDSMPQKSRNALIEEYATGIKADHSDFVKEKIFANGHRIEFLLRPFAEKFWEDDLYPTCAEEDIGGVRPLGASLDGITMDEKTIWECKSMNDEIRNTHVAEDLPIRYRIQMEQQLLVTGAERCIFSGGNFDKDGNLTEEKHLLYLPDFQLRTRIILGWAQFHKDVAAYVPSEPKAAPVAEEIMQLPAVMLTVTGALQASNLGEVTPRFDEYLAETKTELVTDDDFANGEANAKFSRATAKRLKEKAKEVVDQITTVSEAVATLELYAGKFDAMGLKLEKAVKDQKEVIKRNIALKAMETFREYLAEAEATVKPIRLPVPMPDFDQAMKNQRNIAGLQNKADAALAVAAVDIGFMATDVRKALDWCKAEAAGMSNLFPDLQTIIFKPLDDFKLVVTTRIAEQKANEAAAIEAAVAKAREEEAAKLAAKPVETPPPAVQEAAQPVAAQVKVGQDVQAAEKAVIDHQGEIAEYLKSATFKTTKDENLVRAHLVEFVKFQQSRKVAK